MAADYLELGSEWLSYATVAFTVAASTVKVIGDLRREKKSAEKLEKIEAIASEEPEKLKPAWDLARRMLEGYFDGNLRQVNQIFYVAIGVMMLLLTLVCHLDLIESADVAAS